MGKSSISMGHLYHGSVSHNQRVSYEGFHKWGCPKSWMVTKVKNPKIKGNIEVHHY